MFTVNLSWNKRDQTKKNCDSQSQQDQSSQLLLVRFPNLGSDVTAASQEW